MTNTTPSQQARLLIVDDELVLAETMSDILKLRGFEVELAGNGLEALDKLAARPIDLVITDMNMPKMDGMQLLTQVRKLYPALPVIIISGFSQTDAAAALAEGAVAFLGKPLPAADLLREIQRHLAP